MRGVNSYMLCLGRPPLWGSAVFNAKGTMQLDFLSHLYRPVKQLELLPHRNKLFMRQHDESDIQKFFGSITPEEVERHTLVWQGLVPSNDSEIFMRWLFAFCSVHTTYQNNIMGYNNIKNWWGWINRKTLLHTLIDESGMGLTNNRTKYLIQFACNFWADPDSYKKQENETWAECRNRLVAKILGLGKAKVSFALEMLNMEKAEVFCADTHLFQAYGYRQDTHADLYEEIEAHWVGMCKMFSVPSPIARAIYWNRKKGEKDCLYWAKVFKGETI